MIKIDNRRWIYDLENGEKFRLGKHEFEVVSPYNDEFIHNGLDTLCHCRPLSVYAIDLGYRYKTDIIKFDENFKVHVLAA